MRTLVYVLDKILFVPHKITRTDKLIQYKHMKEYFIYILQCADNSYYVGLTNDIERRLIEHQEGKNKSAYTYNRRPVELVFYTSFSNVDMAIETEKQIKKWSRAKKQALIEGRYDNLINLAKKKFNKK